MDLVHERAAGIDISKGDAKVAIRSPGKRAGTFSTEVTTWGSTTNQIDPRPAGHAGRREGHHGGHGGNQ